MATKPQASPAISFVEKVRLWGTAFLTLCAVVTILGGILVQFVTNDVKKDIQAIRTDLRDFAANTHAREVADSVRFERVLGIVELAVVAIVEPSNSPERSEAVAELRRHQGLSLAKGN